ncbi:MAG: hypothetical protein HFJ75_07700 [Eggerthellaceae bacterium]|nr:hypothetical protein [Eggerthellaceae bacterium]
MAKGKAILSKLRAKSAEAGDAFTSAPTSTPKKTAARKSQPKSSTGYEKRDYDNARAAGFSHEESVARARFAAQKRAGLKAKYTGRTAEENKAIAARSVAESWAKVSSTNYERARKSQEAEVEGWLTGRRKKRRRS